MKFKISIIIANALFINFSYATPYLFEQYPALQAHIPYVSLCDLPTPIVKLTNFGNHIGCNSLFMKRDDLTGKNSSDGFRLYGGNKPRKLEFLLADAMQNNSQTIITYGCAGSNHALATAVYARELGLQSWLMLTGQPNSHIVRQNLLLDHYYNARLSFFPSAAVRNAAADEVLNNDTTAYLIPTGGSNTIGVLGYVNAAFELAHQIAIHDIEEPDFIYVATGTCATTAGLLLGLRLANIQSKVVAVCVFPEGNTNYFEKNIKKLFMQTVQELHTLDESIPLVDFPENNVMLNKKFCGKAYGVYMPETIAAISLFKEMEEVALEGTYSAKPIAAIMEDIVCNNIQDKTILFWNTYCGLDFSLLTHLNDYKALPEEFHVYFEQDVQSFNAA